MTTNNGKIKSLLPENKTKVTTQYIVKDENGKTLCWFENPIRLARYLMHCKETGTKVTSEKIVF